MNTSASTYARFSPTYWVKLSRFAAICIATVLLVLLGYLIYSEINLARSGMHPIRIPITQTPSNYGIADYEVVSFTTADGLTLQGRFIPSHNGAAVIAGHGHAANREDVLPHAALLAQHGYGVLLFDWRAHGESDGDTTTLGNTEVQDAEAAFEFLAARPEVDPERIGVLGLSMGGSILVEAAARNPRIRAAVIEAAYSSLEDITRFRLGKIPLAAPLAIWWGQMETGTDVDLVRPIDEICDISPRPLLLIYGTNDNAIPPDSAERMAMAACDPYELWMVEGGGHTDTISFLPEEYESRVIGFLDAELLQP